MDKNGEQPKENSGIHANKLPAEIVGRFLQNLSVGDRLKSEQVSPHWKRALQKWGWTEQKKLDTVIVFEGLSRENEAKLWETPDDGRRQLVSLLCQLKALEEINFYNFVVDGESLEMIVETCLNLRSLSFCDHLLTEEAFFQIAKFSNLTILELQNPGEKFTDAVLKAIAKRGQLKKLVIVGNKSDSLTDDSIVYLIEQCKITERSLEVAVAEVKRRHGTPPRSLPTGPLDERIFYVQALSTGIECSRIREIINGNPWILFRDDPRKISS